LIEGKKNMTKIRKIVYGVFQATVLLGGLIVSCFLSYEDREDFEEWVEGWFWEWNMKEGKKDLRFERRVCVGDGDRIVMLFLDKEGRVYREEEWV
jgi:hypothetical protein